MPAVNDKRELVSTPALPVEPSRSTHFAGRTHTGNAIAVRCCNNVNGAVGHGPVGEAAVVQAGYACSTGFGIKIIDKNYASAGANTEKAGR